MRILFCNIAWMKYYNGITHDDKPVNGGSWVKENENAIECLNFTPYNDRIYCGYVSTKSNRGNRNQLHIEKLEGITKEDNIAEEILNGNLQRNAEAVVKAVDGKIKMGSY